MNAERCYCGANEAQVAAIPTFHVKCWRAYVAGLRRALQRLGPVDARNLPQFVADIHAEIAEAERGKA